MPISVSFFSAKQPAKDNFCSKTLSPLIVALFSMIAPTPWVGHGHAASAENKVPLPQTPSLTTAAVGDSDQQRLEKLSAAERKLFKSKLKEATALFFDNHYRLAMPLFQEIAARADTVSVLHMYGLAAYRSGMLDVAITKFQTILQRQPANYAVGMDLALVFLQKGDTKRAEMTLEKVRQAHPPKVVLDEVDRLLTATRGKNKQKKPFLAALRVGGGVQYDSNISAQTDNLPVGFANTPQQKGAAVPLSANVDTLLDLKKHGLAWHNQLSLYRIAYDDRSIFDFSQVDVRTGLEHDSEKLHLRLPVGFIYRTYGHEALSDGWYLAPYGQWQLRKNLDLNLGYRVDDETFKKQINRDQDHTTQSITAGPSWRLPGDRLQIVALTTGYANRDARVAGFSYDDWTLGSSYSTHFDQSNLDAMVQAEYMDRRYDGNSVSAIIFADAPSQREDKRFSLTAVLSKTFREIYAVSASYGYLRNDSNTTIFDYDKYVLGLNFSVMLDNR